MFVETKDIDMHSSPEPKTHRMDGESGNTLERAWCDECGCGIWMKNITKTPDLTFMKAGLFKPGEIPNPHMENWLRNKEPWETPATGTQRKSDVN